MDPLLGYFAPHIAVVNLPSRTDRRRETLVEMAKMGIEPPAFSFFAAQRPSDAGPFENRGTRGAYLSHLALWAEAIAASVPHLLVLEDDIEFPPSFATASAQVLAELQGQPWDLVQFGYTLETSCTKQLTGAGPHLRSFGGEVTGGHFYAINGPAIPVVFNFLSALLNGPIGDPRRGPMSPDGALNVMKWELPHVHRLVAHPSLAGQRKSRSDLRPRWFDQIPGLRHIADSARVSMRKPHDAI
jgi:glycosyl transferase, family 25